MPEYQNDLVDILKLSCYKNQDFDSFFYDHLDFKNNLALNSRIQIYQIFLVFSSHSVNTVILSDQTLKEWALYNRVYNMVTARETEN